MHLRPKRFSRSTYESYTGCAGKRAVYIARVHEASGASEWPLPECWTGQSRLPAAWEGGISMGKSCLCASIVMAWAAFVVPACSTPVLDPSTNPILGCKGVVLEGYLPEWTPEILEKGVQLSWRARHSELFSWIQRSVAEFSLMHASCC